VFARYLSAYSREWNNSFGPLVSAADQSPEGI